MIRFWVPKLPLQKVRETKKQLRNVVICEGDMRCPEFTSQSMSSSFSCVCSSALSQAIVYIVAYVNAEHQSDNYLRYVDLTRLFI